MEAYLFPAFCTIAGLSFLIRNISYLRNEEKLRIYLTSSPKAKLWVNKYGIEKTVSLSKNIFLPLGCAIAAILLCFGIWSLSTIAISS